MEEVLIFLQTNKVFFMATTQGDQPKVRPLALVMEFEGKIYFGVGEQKEVFQQMQINPKVEICSVNQTGQWMRLHGVAVFDQRPEVFAMAVKTLPVLGDMYGGPDKPRLGVFHLIDAEAVFYDALGGSTTVKL
ncbi:MAG: pyridoxamine 5'-phosphate oxidase family protein [Candidatus Adiutrix sp.]|jgi:uncharacterized pyridoxamine 5'-phosphate oxidase family protein|nr:pyridoxamine 5'-phosphate oxidase family protein [Candidatus Adiutrix sp.]